MYIFFLTHIGYATEWVGPRKLWVQATAIVLEGRRSQRRGYEKYNPFFTLVGDSNLKQFLVQKTTFSSKPLPIVAQWLHKFTKPFFKSDKTLLLIITYCIYVNVNTFMGRP